MVKVPTEWSGNPSAEANLLTYNSATTTYNASTVTYSSIVVGDQSDSEKVVTGWTKPDIEATDWAENISYDDNQYAYDSTAVYDSATRTYDGVTTGESEISTKEPVAWSEA